MAEVLITLTIIGVIAALTIPNLMQSYKKHEVENKLLKFYSTMNNALSLSERDNGNIEDWELGDFYDYDANQKFFDTYIKNYIKYTSVKQEHTHLPTLGIKVTLEDGSAMNISGMILLFYPNANKTEVFGKDIFLFYINRSWVARKEKIFPYNANGGYDQKSVEKGINDSTYGCIAGANRWNCALLIQRNNWKIPDNYPIRF